MSKYSKWDIALLLGSFASTIAGLVLWHFELTFVSLFIFVISWRMAAQYRLIQELEYEIDLLELWL